MTSLRCPSCLTFQRKPTNLEDVVFGLVARVTALEMQMREFVDPTARQEMHDKRLRDLFSTEDPDEST